MSELPRRLAALSPEKLALLSKHLGGKTEERNARHTIPRRSKANYYPLSYAQQRLWFVEQLQPGSTAYNMGVGVRLRGRLDLAALGRTLDEVARRHEALRTTFREVGGEPAQVVGEAAGVRVEVSDLSGLGEAEREAEARRVAAEEAGRAFDLGAGPLLRVRVLKLGAEEHVAVLTMHHIISDGWSLGVLVGEVGELYAAYSRGQESPLEELPVQYADYAVWQREWLRGEALEAQLSYWREQLAGAPAVLELPTDRPRPAVQTYAGALRRFSLSEELSSALGAMSRREGVTLFMTLLAAWQVLLMKYSAQEDVLVGAPVANRTHKETEGLIGFFVNMLVMRTRLHGDPTFREVLGRVKDVALGAYAHRDVPFEKLVEELRPERSAGHSPLFQAAFVLQNAPTPEMNLSNITLTPFDLHVETTPFDITLTMEETARGLVGSVQYSTELFDASTIDRLLAHFNNLLQGVVADVGARIASLPVLSADEERQLLVQWNLTHTDYPRNRSIHQLFREQAALTPDAVAVVYNAERLSYAELDARSDALAARLRASGVAVETKVGVMMERSLELVVSLLGVLKAGGVYVPLDAQYPSERLAFMIEDAGVEVVLTQRALRRKVEGLDAAGQSPRAICVDEDWARVASAGASQSAPTEEATCGERLAYVIYTSGSTGRPKGVAVLHRGVVRLVKETNYAELGGEQVFLQLAPVSFDASTLEVWGALLNGGRLVLYPERVLTGQELGRVIREQGVSTMWLTASLFNAVVNEDARSLRGLRQLLVGGEALSVAHVKRALENLPETQLINGYGPTENTTFTCCYRITRDADEGRGSIPIGLPVSNTEVFVLNAHLRPVPVGVAGQLFVGGDGLARGYLNRPELTAERFRPHPFSRTPGARLYATGDLVRYLPDGRLEYLGRIDQQVKVRGFRIELGEIETTLLEHPSVGEAAVVVREDRAGDKRLVAYCVAAEGQLGAGSNELRGYLQQKLPAYMIPSTFVEMKELPLTPNGKVDRNALPAPEGAGSEGEYVAPRTAVEEVLADIWREVLGVERVGAEENFFDLGGHSLLATRVMTRVREVFRVEAPLRLMFETPTLAALARSIEAERGDRRDVEAAPLVPVPRDRNLPLSYAQQRLWFVEQLQPGSTAYNMGVGVRLRGRLDLAALGRTLDEVARRHEALRTTFREVGGEPAQVVGEAAGVRVEVSDLSGLGEAEREAEARRVAAEEAGRAFDLGAGPLLRVRVLKLGAEEHVAVLTMHHIVSDGWSLGVLVGEVGELYAAYSRGQESPLEELPVQYADYAVWQREWLSGETLERQLAYWRGQLAGAPAVLELPTDRPRPPVQSYHGRHCEFTLPPELSRQLKALSRREGVTLFMSLLSSFVLLLYRYTSQTDILVGTPVANRNRAETEGLIGFFVNTLVLRTDLSGEPTFRELLGRVREAALDAYAHQDVPFEKLVDELQPERDLSRTPLFQVMFVLQNAPAAELELPGLSVSVFGGETRTAKFDLTVAVNEGAGGVSGAFEYNTDLFDEATVERMTRHWRKVLEEVVSNPQARVGEVEVFEEEERRRLLVEWNGRGGAAEAQGCLHEMFEEQAARTPAAVAVVYEGEEVSYEELNRRAEALAQGLRRRGVGAESLVGIMMERSVEMVVGLLGVLKAGGAYVPLDPSYPPERLRFMIEDADVDIVITQAHLSHLLADDKRQIISVDADWGAVAEHGGESPARHTNPDSAAYVIYTSGSTGRPKGAVVTHRNVARLFTATRRTFDFGEQDVWTLFHSYAFDFSVWELWGALLYGGRLVVAPYRVSRNPEEFYALLCREGVTVLNQTPSAFRQLMKVDEAAGQGEQDAERLRLRLVIFGGEALNIGGLKAWFDRHGDEHPQLVNMYGITETTVHVTWRVLNSKDCAPGAGSVIGAPLEDLEVYVLDSQRRLLPVGVWGELYVGGGGVARGYLGRPGLTAERFVPHPFSDSGGQRLYRTGDVARWLGAGELEYKGRIDEQVKVRGFRIELGEVEAALQAHHEVREALVLAKEDETGEKRLTAYVVPAGTAAADADTGRPARGLKVGELRDFVRERLPDYMIPSTFLVLERMPLTANGKVDRRALLAMKPEHPAAGGAPEEPRGMDEEVLAAIWSRVLGVSEVGVQDNFFELGGDSILSVQLVAQAKRRGLNVTLPLLFRHQTIRELAAALREAEGETAEAVTHEPFGLLTAEDRPRMPPGIEDAYPVALLQAGMLFESAFRAEEAIYHDVNSVHLRTPYNLEAIKTAVAQLIARRPVLRTSFDLTNFSEPLQLVHRAVELPLQVDDLRHLSTAEQDEYLASWFDEVKRRSFDWSGAPLLRFQVHLRAEHEFQFSVNYHHAILDGWSVAAMLTELFQYYIAGLRAVEIPTRSPDTFFREYVELERRALASEQTRSFWGERLAEHTVTRLPRLSPPPGPAAPRRLMRIVPVSPETSDGLRRLARRAVVPLKSVLLAAHLRVLSLLGGSRSVVTGIVSHGRPEKTDAEQGLGLFLNMLPFHLKLRGGSWLELVQQTFEAEREMLPFRRYPMVQIQRDLGGQELFEAAFNFTKFHIYQSLEKLEEVQVLGGASYGESNFAFWANFSVDLTDAQVKLSVEGDGTQLHEGQVEAIAGYYARALSEMASSPETRYERQRLLSEEEQRQLLYEWNNAQDTCSTGFLLTEKCVHELFEEQIKHSPDASALYFNGQTLSYRQLNRRANQLAHYLQSAGVGAGSVVGIFLDRSPEMVIALLAVLKAGGAYLPLDLSYTKGHLALILQDSGLQTLLTRQRLTENLPPFDGNIICLDSDRESISAGSEENPATGTTQANTAYIIYTSGSTGVPKGVIISHGALANFIEAACADYGLKRNDRVLQFFPISADSAADEIYPCLTRGGTLVLRTDEMLSSVANFLRQCREWAITVLDLPTAFWHEMVSGLEHETVEFPPSIHLVLFGGEKLNAQYLAVWFQHVGQRVRLLDSYGPTEATVAATACDLTAWAGGQRPLTDVPIGRPLRNVQVYILDEHLCPTPVGVPGELHIGGRGLADGYLNRPMLTAEKYIPNPFSAEAGTRLYKTGDFARFLPDGNIEFIGRVDSQVKIRGFRIELGEIEAALARHPYVSGCVVMAREDAPNEKLLVAYVVGSAEPLTSIELRTFLKERLPDYMIPQSFVMLKALPLTPNGKVDRRALLTLAEPDRRVSEASEAYVPPRDAVELQLAQIWKDVLKVPSVGVADNFFHLGGHSLSAIRLMARIERTFGKNLPASSLLQGATVEQQARLLREHSGRAPMSSLVAIKPEGSGRPIFCVHPAGGNVFRFIDLSACLEKEQPFYGLQSRGLSGEEALHTRIEEMAAHYIDAIRKVQPEGPYIISGWSMGGVVAFEMAQQLHLRQQVEKLILLDSKPFTADEPLAEDDAALLASFAHDLGLPLGELDIAWESLEHLDLNQKLPCLMKLAQTANIVPSDIKLSQIQHLLRVFQTNVRAMHNYRARTYAGRITLVQAAERLSDDGDDFATYWNKLAAEGLDSYTVPGNHFSMFRYPHVKALAERLSQCVNRK